MSFILLLRTPFLGGNISLYFKFKILMFRFFSVLGIQTSQDARFYGLSTKFEPFSNKDKPVVFQFTVKHEQNIDCGGGYAKIFDCSLDSKDMHGETPYLVMFGKYCTGFRLKLV